MSEGQVIEDYYATLGVVPKSEAAEIRAAYLALMRQYHPDKNDSAEAVGRAHAIIAAFKVLGDVEKRLHYDWARRRAAEEAAAPPPARFGKLPRVMAGVALALLLIVPLSFLQFPVMDREPQVAPAARVAEVADVPDVQTKPIQAPRKGPIEPPLAVVTPIPAPRPAVVEPLKTEPEPPRPSVDRAPLVPATLTPAPPAPRVRRQARNDVQQKKPPAGASAKCRFVTPGAEAAICNNDDLAALDQSVVTFYNQSLQFGDVTKRGALLDSRIDFLVRREECRSDACLQSLHLAHLRALSAIMEKRLAKPPR